MPQGHLRCFTWTCQKVATAAQGVSGAVLSPPGSGLRTTVHTQLGFHSHLAMIIAYAKRRCVSLLRVLSLPMLPIVCQSREPLIVALAAWPCHKWPGRRPVTLEPRCPQLPTLVVMFAGCANFAGDRDRTGTTGTSPKPVCGCACADQNVISPCNSPSRPGFPLFPIPQLPLPPPARAGQ